MPVYAKSRAGLLFISIWRRQTKDVTSLVNNIIFVYDIRRKILKIYQFRLNDR